LFPVVFLQNKQWFDMKFFFHVREDNGDISRDVEGQEFPSLDVAYREAFSASREMLGERLLHGGNLGCRQIEITNEQGDILAVLNAKDTLLQEDEKLRSFKDDVTQSAPTAKTNSSKSGAR
jgi:hypothetical protein